MSFKQGKALCVGFSKHSGLYPQGVCILIFGKPSPQGLFLFKTAILSIVRQFCHSPNTLSLISWENIQVGAFCLVELFLGVGRSAFCLQNKIKVKGRMWNHVHLLWFNFFFLKKKKEKKKKICATGMPLFNHENYLESNSKYKNLHILLVLETTVKDGVLLVINTSK